ncbi:RNA-binding domain-containing protein [Nostoc sp. 'Peltigera membranacea cyanobiont' 232]|uniref:RNA-binding domain-containing protein n=1 Tax=Nostoc sp. 'Peltigera membranacea cyanobiont' 232 TaxID=2014531 RepID=UPI000B95110F|nr:RNA-binding domain-containing protein [Nostoc sp. 'Peltigera membranacea cyanobiont' 232]OYE06420.1 transcriptional regulator [Nostoc sp. 'Peltigera membranacea cyanobiont' 232]
MDLETLLQRINLGEDQEIEFKSADGGLPNDIWETVSAFANTDGGYIVLGVSEGKGGLAISGVRNPDGLLKNFWNNHNNPQKLNKPICSNSEVQILKVEAHNLVVIKVPRATRTQRPVYINNNPMTGIYKRNFEGDYRCTLEEVQQMFQDASNEPQDIKILEGFNLTDLDLETLKSFRQRFSSREPDHPWLALDEKDLLIQLGGWRCDRLTAKEGLTLAGLLMFGRERSILDALPHYQLDYQEQLSKDPETRWTYRLTLDGKWEPNLFNFYYRVYSRLVNDINVPFQLDRDAVRRGETHVHEALREALVNSLIHADHVSTRPLVVTKFTNSFLFYNPGRLRISLQQLYDGGISDPRNPNLQKMFQMLGLGEKAGSGFGKILRAWKEQQWFYPLVSEELDLEMTSVTLPMVSLIPENVEKELREIIGDDYCELTELDCIILVLAHQFGDICNSDIQCYRREHPRDIGDCLKRLVNNGWLERSGRGRGTYYALVNQQQSDLLALLPSSEHYEPSSEHYEPSSEHYGLSSEHYKRLKDIAVPVREKGRVDQELVERVILELCSEHYLALRTLADLLNRKPDSIRNHYLSLMLDRGLIELRYPEQLNHPQQAYKTVSSPNTNLL